MERWLTIEAIDDNLRYLRGEIERLTVQRRNEPAMAKRLNVKIASLHAREAVWRTTRLAVMGKMRDEARERRRQET